LPGGCEVREVSIAGPLNDDRYRERARDDRQLPEQWPGMLGERSGRERCGLGAV